MNKELIKKIEFTDDDIIIHFKDKKVRWIDERKVKKIIDKICYIGGDSKSVGIGDKINGGLGLE